MSPPTAANTNITLFDTSLSLRSGAMLINVVKKPSENCFCAHLGVISAQNPNFTLQKATSCSFHLGHLCPPLKTDQSRLTEPNVQSVKICDCEVESIDTRFHHDGPSEAMSVVKKIVLFLFYLPKCASNMLKGMASMANATIAALDGQEESWNRLQTYLREKSDAEVCILLSWMCFHVSFVFRYKHSGHPGQHRALFE